MQCGVRCPAAVTGADEPHSRFFDLVLCRALEGLRAFSAET